jgi:DNA topoisomerase VI subunit B
MIAVTTTGRCAPSLTRKIFRTSRLAEFASKSELIKLTGHDIEDWPIVVVKETIDNALDEAEEAGVAPIVEVCVTEIEITISDLAGRGIAPETVAALTDYTMRTSSREAYVSPTRGAQGHALQTILAMGFVLDGERGETVIESQGVAHRIVFDADPVRRVPRIAHERGPSVVRKGVKMTVRWPNRASSILTNARDDFCNAAQTFAWLNPHLGLTATWFGDPCVAVAASNPAWTKWLPSQPTSPHWYDAPRFARLIAAHIAYAEDHGIPCPTVREFVAEFRGLSGTAKGKAICEAAEASGRTLSEFYGEGRDLERISSLLKAMQGMSRPVKPRDLGVIGRDHLARFVAAAGSDPDSFQYSLEEQTVSGVPYLAEVAFAHAPDAETRTRVTGLNFSPSVGGHPFHSLGPVQSLDGLLSGQFAGPNEPVIVCVHLTAPRLDFLDRGKSSVALPREVSG